MDEITEEPAALTERVAALEKCGSIRQRTGRAAVL
jgi:hypothetical protein